jgi:tetratricopeptide (TPR) repeat protein
MFARRLDRRMLPAALVAAIAFVLTACGEPTPEDLLNQADQAMRSQDGYEADLLLGRVLETKGLDEALAIEAHMRRAVNAQLFLGDTERARRELEAVLELTPADSDEGMMAALGLADMTMQTSGLASFEAELDQVLTQVEPLSRNALNVSLHRYQMLASTGASPELAAFFPALFAQAVSTESLLPHERRDLALELSRHRAMIADAMGEPDTSIDVFQGFIEAFPDSDAARFMPFEIVTRLRNEGREAEAEELRESAFAQLGTALTAAETSAEQATVGYSVADAYLMLGDMESASAEYSRLFDTYLDYHNRPRAMLGWAATVAGAGSLEAARSLAARAALEYPGTQIHQVADGLIAQIEGDIAARDATPEAETNPDAMSESATDEMATASEPSSP